MIRVSVSKKRIMFFTIISISLVFIVLAMFSKPASNHPFFSDNTMVIAHRGGKALWPENTLFAFAKAENLGVDAIELDVRLSADHKLIVIHDEDVSRTTNGSGLVKELTLEEIQALDAAHRFSLDDGVTFPYRGTGITIPTLNEVFKQFPNMRFSIDIKVNDPDIIKPLCALIQESNMSDKVLVGSEHSMLMKQFRGQCTAPATGGTISEGTFLLFLSWLHLETLFSPSSEAFSIPETYRNLRLASKRSIEASHRQNIKIIVWTIEDADTMSYLIRWGADGIVTSHPDILLQLVE